MSTDRRTLRIVRDWSDVDDALFFLRRLRAEIARATGEFDAGIAELQAKKRAALEAPLAEEKRLQELVTAFVIEHREDVEKDGARSRVLIHGTVGFRKGARTISFVRSEKETVKLLRARGMMACIRVKEEADKPAILKLDEAVFDGIGVVVKSEDRVYVETLDGEPVAVAA